MDYNFDALNPRDFEHLIQSLARKILGNGLITFGDGPDGGREATFEGKAPFPGEADCWEGNWIIQAKFKSRAAKETNKSACDWVKKQFQQEMKKFTSRKVKVGIPHNYLFFTNVVLTPTAGTGCRDQMEELVRQYTKKIPHIKVFGYDDLCGFLDNNRDVATAYSSFILPGDILQKLYDILMDAGTTDKNHCQILGRFLETEFRDDLQSRLDHAGKLTSDKIHLEKVFVDLYATKDGIASKEEEQKRFLETCITIGNTRLQPDAEEGRFVLTGGPGCGKSTMTQFLCQVYRAYFLKNLDTCATSLPELDGFIADFQRIIPVTPTCFRYPVRIILKDFAAWLVERKKQDKNHSLLMYLKYKIEKKGDGDTIEIKDLRQLLGKLSFVFIFDGLDEVPQSSNREEVLAEIRNFIEIDIRRSDCDALIIATTRPQGYTNEFDRTRYTHLTITDMQEEDCFKYLERLLMAIEPVDGEREKHLDILKRALAHDVTVSLMKTPLQISIMAILVKSGGEPPRYKYDLFTEYYNIILKRERQKNVCAILCENPEYIDHIHNQLGFTLQLAAEQSENPAAHISHDEFRDLVSTYLLSQGFSKEDVEEKTGQILQAVIERLVFLDEVVERRIGFNIRSLQEYFAANYYVKNQPDEIIRERLKVICKSAYWRNTFLFVLGYIYKHKNYLVDSVESICRELNGSADEPGSASSSTVCKLGSWLALEILAESIFRGNPGFENKFAGLLKELFTISPSYKHSRFGNLSDKIKQKWILPLIDKYTSQGVYEDQLAAWTIAIYLLKHGDEKVKEVMDKNWPSSEAEVKLVKHFIKLNVKKDQWFIEKFTNALKRNSTFTFYKELSNDKFFYSIVISATNDFDARRILIQNFFIYSTNSSMDLYQNKTINHLLGEKIIDNENFRDLSFFKEGNRMIITPSRKLFFYNEGDWIEINLFYKALVLETCSVKSSNKNLDKLIKFFNHYKIDYLKRFVQFLKSPNNNSLKEFFSALKNEPEETFILIKRYFRRINWLLAKILSEEGNLDNIIQGIEDNRYGDIKDWKDLECRIIRKEITYEQIYFFLYYSKSVFSSTSPEILKPFFRTYYLNFISDPNLSIKQGISRQLLWIISIGLYYNLKNFIEYLNENSNVIQELFLCLRNVKSDDIEKGEFNFIFFGLLQFLTDHEIIELEEQEGKLVERFKFYEKYFRTINKEIISTIFPKLVKVLNHAMIINRESSLIRLPVWVFIYESFENLPPLEFNFNDLHKASFKDPDNEACRILLCLFDPDMNQSKAHHLVEASKPLLKILPQLSGYFLELIKKFGLKGDWVEPLLLELYKMVDRHDHDQKTPFENYFKDMLENQPSGINDPDIRNRLGFPNL